MKQLFAALIGGVALTACASLPPVTVQYYPTAGLTEVTVLETLACTPDRSKIVAAYALKPETRYFSQREKRPHQVEIRGVIPQWSDGIAGFTFYEDGRLKSINSTATGRGEEIVQAGIGLISVAAGFPAVASIPGLPDRHGLMSEPGRPLMPLPTNPCDRIVGADGKGVLTIEHRARLDHASLAAGPVALVLTERNAEIRSHFADLLPTLQLEAGAPRRFAPTAVYTGQSDADVVLLPLNHTAAVDLVLTTLNDQITSTIVIAQADTYDVPLPRAAPFGERTISLGLAESGAVTTLSYGTKSGGAGAMNAGAGILGLYAADSASTRAAEVKGEADLIAQLQRLARCRADPPSCT